MPTRHKIKSWDAPIVWITGGLGLLVLYPRMFLSAGALVPGTPQDTRFNMYLLEHVWLWLHQANGHASLWNMPVFHPAANAFAYSDLLIGLIPFYWPWRLIGLAPDSAYQLCLVAISALDYLAAYRLLRDCLRLDRLPSAAGAFLFAFGSARAAQLDHLQLLPQFYSVFAVYAAIKAWTAKDTAPGWIAAAFTGLILQAYTGFYLFWFLVFSAGLFGVWLLVLPSSRTIARSAAARLGPVAAIGGLGALVVLHPLIAHYRAAAQALGMREYGDIVSWIPFPQSWFFMGWGSLLYGWLIKLDAFRLLPMMTEHAMGHGLVTTACCVAGWGATRKTPWSTPLALTVITLVLLCTQFPSGLSGTGDGLAVLSAWSPWALVHRLVPGAAAVRAVTRVSVFLLLPASIFLACALARLKKPAALAALALLCAAEQVWFQNAYYKKEAARREVSALAARIGAACGSFFYIAELAGPHRPLAWPRYQLDAMWASLETGVPTVNGYSGNFPPEYAALNDNVASTPEDETRLTASLSSWAAPEKPCVVR